MNDTIIEKWAARRQECNQPDRCSSDEEKNFRHFIGVNRCEMCASLRALSHTWNSRENSKHNDGDHDNNNNNISVIAVAACLVQRCLMVHTHTRSLAQSIPCAQHTHAMHDANCYQHIRVKSPAHTLTHTFHVKCEIWSSCCECSVWL